MRQELISRIGGIGTRLMFSGLVTRENSGKIRKINIKKSVLVGKVLTSPEIKINFHSGSVWEFLNVSRPKTRPGSNQSRMMGRSRDREKVVPECSGQEISRIFLKKIRFPGNGIQECRPLDQIIRCPYSENTSSTDVVSFDYYLGAAHSKSG